MGASSIGLKVLHLTCATILPYIFIIIIIILKILLVAVMIILVTFGV